MTVNEINVASALSKASVFGRGLTAVTFLVAVGGIGSATEGCGKARPVGAGDEIRVVDVPPAPAPVAPAVAATEVKHPPRRLEDVNRSELENTLPPGAPVEITAPQGDDEAFRLAQEIRAFLHREKYPVAPIARRTPDPSAKGVGLEPLPGGKWRVVVGAAE
jgi:hypothetical protein